MAGTRAKLRLAVVGAGKHGSRYATHAARDVDGIELVAVCRRDKVKGEALANDLGCELSTEAEKLVTRRDIDAVVLAAVPSLLPTLIPLAVQSGKRLIVEKPVAPSIASGVPLLDLIETSGAYCLAGHTLRFNTAVEALRRELPSLGRIDSFLFTQRFPAQPDLVWLDTPEQSGGGNVLHTGVHCFDLLRWLSGSEVEAAAATLRSVQTTRTEDHFVSLLTMRRPGLLAQVACSRSTDSRNGLIEVSGERGQIVVDHVLGSGYRLGPRGREEIVVDAPRMTVKSLLERFVDDATRDTPPLVSYRDGLAAVAIADACYRSAGSGSFEDVFPLPSR
jgi:predicted dehydrogenase